MSGVLSVLLVIPIGGISPTFIQTIVAIATAENMPNGESDQLALPPKRKKKGKGAGARRK